MATREDKKYIRNKKRQARKHKKYLEFQKIKALMWQRDMSFVQARHFLRRGYVFQCEMGWGSCEERGYCNGDC